MPGNIGRFKIQRTIGSGGSCKVKCGIDTASGRTCAIKVMNEDMDDQTNKLVMTEMEAMSKLQHPNVLSILEYGVDKYVKDSGKERDVSYIALELAAGGELFDFVAISGRFDEPLARYFFRQFMAGLDYCHKNGVCHRDIKPENLLLDQHFGIKIADFGFAAPIEGRDGSGELKTNLGTMNYMAPEIHLKQPYQGEKVDLFAAAIVLFIMVAQHPPFTTAQPGDPFYRCLAANRGDIFWKTHCKSKPNGMQFFSEEFKDLVSQMLALDPNNRPSIEQIMAHSWMQGPEPTKEQVMAEFSKREEDVKASIEADKEAKQLDKAARVANRQKNVMRSGPAKTDDNGVLQPFKTLEPYERVFATNTEFFSTYNADMIEDALKESLENQSIKPTINEKKYKMKFELQTKDQGGQVQQIKMCVRILKVDEQTVCVEFTKLGGDQIRYHEHFNDFKNQVLTAMNDAILA